MDNNIYQIDTWQPTTFYFKDKVLTNNNLFYYVAFDYTSSSSITTDINNGNLNGYIFDRGQQKPYFTWKANYNFTNENEPRVKKIQFGDGYFQLVPDGINNILLNYNFTFEGNLHNITAILHFLATRNGSESFCMLAPAPRGQILRFYCPKWSDIQRFYNNYSITANFLQTPV
jgi:phage-related protein